MSCLLDRLLRRPDLTAASSYSNGGGVGNANCRSGVGLPQESLPVIHSIHGMGQMESRYSLFKL